MISRRGFLIGTASALIAPIVCAGPIALEPRLVQLPPVSEADRWVWWKLQFKLKTHKVQDDLLVDESFAETNEETKTCIFVGRANDEGEPDYEQVAQVLQFVCRNLKCREYKDPNGTTWSVQEELGEINRDACMVYAPHGILPVVQQQRASLVFSLQGICYNGEFEFKTPLGTARTVFFTKNDFSADREVTLITAR